MICPEVFYQRAVLIHLSSLGNSVREEVAYGRRRFDALAYDGIRLLGVEVKCHDWRRAIKQARYQNLCCDEAAIALPQQRVSAAVLDAAKAEGIGVIAIGSPPEWRVEWKLQPVRSAVVVSHRTRLLVISGW